jgi:hypothetical protein
MKTFALFLLSVCTALMLKAQDVLDNRVVGIVAFSSGRTQDSIAAKDVYAAVGRILVQTKRFTILDVPEWKKTQDEMDRQKGEAFMEQSIISMGKSLGAKVLVIGSVKNAEVYQDNMHYAARVDYEVKFVDVQNGKSLAASAFKGDSEDFTNISSKASKGLQKMIMPSILTSRGNWKTMYFTSSAFAALSEADKNTIMGKLIDAIESTTGKFNAWVRTTFNFNLLCLGASDEDKKKGFQHVLIEGGTDISIKQGDRLSLVLITEMETSRGKIRDESPVADLQVEEVHAQTSQCKVTNGGKKIDGSKDQIARYRVVFK